MSRTLTGLAEEGAAILPDFLPLDIVGSPYAVADYEVPGSPANHGWAATVSLPAVLIPAVEGSSRPAPQGTAATIRAVPAGSRGFDG